MTKYVAVILSIGFAVNSAWAEGPRCPSVLMPMKSNVISANFVSIPRLPDAGNKKSADVVTLKKAEVQKSEVEKYVDTRIVYLGQIKHIVVSDFFLGVRQNNIWILHKDWKTAEAELGRALELDLSKEVPGEKLEILAARFQEVQKLMAESQVWEKVVAKGKTLAPPPGQEIKRPLPEFEQKELVQRQADLHKLTALTKMLSLGFDLGEGYAGVIGMVKTHFSDFVELLGEMRSDLDISKIDLDLTREIISGYESLIDMPVVNKEIQTLNSSSFNSDKVLAQDFIETVKKARIVFAVYKSPDTKPALRTVPVEKK